MEGEVSHRGSAIVPCTTNLFSINGSSTARAGRGVLPDPRGDAAIAVDLGARYRWTTLPRSRYLIRIVQGLLQGDSESVSPDRLVKMTRPSIRSGSRGQLTSRPATSSVGRGQMDSVRWPCPAGVAAYRVFGLLLVVKREHTPPLHTGQDRPSYSRGVGAS